MEQCACAIVLAKLNVGAALEEESREFELVGLTCTHEQGAISIAKNRVDKAVSRVHIGPCGDHIACDVEIVGLALHLLRHEACAEHRERWAIFVGHRGRDVGARLDECPGTSSLVELRRHEQQRRLLFCRPVASRPNVANISVEN